MGIIWKDPEESRASCPFCGEDNVISENDEETCEHFLDLSRSGFQFKGKEYACLKGHDLDIYEPKGPVGCDLCERPYDVDELVVS